ncbi:TrlF family AAA-like ATPase [Pseudomonas cerasi]|uniref:PHP N-terminal domain protein n=1 Tax=Pseudomonas cerasi TaxID=1583341 RepID=A0A193SJV8_9PSED|nr:AAA family ATPase [Pseudomonas cerasi]CZT27349.1 PHP N-terminal domain protein [Pseudomonas cerasi]SOS14639.1 PHP N-terminal domain protein [Pseudomonas cerasi]
MNIVGARWWKFDFHTHSPASFDYSPTDINLKNTITPKQWLLDYIEKGVECVAITDHNTGAWVDQLKIAAEELRQENKIITLFPGVEITASGNVHILAIFDPSKSSSDIQAVLGAAKFRGTWGDSDSVTEESPENVIEEIIKYGGIAIPAHIDMKAGMCTQISSMLTLKQICRKASAVEVIFPDAVAGDKSFEILKGYKSQNFGLPEVIGSDSHHPSKIGRAFTWVKMSTPSIDGVRLALLDGSSSIKRFNKVEQPNATSDNLLISICIGNAQYCARDKPLTIQFNPWLNSIIGSRGSGKSSILEFIRIGMGRDKDIYKLPETNEIRSSFERFAQIPLNREAEGVLHKDMTISCVVFKQGAYYNLSWGMQRPNIVISKWENNQWQVEVGDASTRFPMKIFSQKQIFDLAKNPSSLLSLIDASSQVDYSSWEMEWADKKNLYVRLSTEVRELTGRLENKDVFLGQLADLNQKISIIESSQHSVVLSNFQQAGAKRSALERFHKDTESALLQLDIMANLNLPDVVEHVFSGEVEDAEAVHESRRLIADLTVYKKQMHEILQKSISRVSEYRQWMLGSALMNKVAGAELQYENLVSQMARSGVTNPSEYKDLTVARDVLSRKIEELNAVELKITETRGELTGVYNQLWNLRKALTARRISFIDQNVNNNPALHLSIDPLANTSEMEGTFRAVIGKQDSTFSSDIYDSEKGQGVLVKLSEGIGLIAFDQSNIDSVDLRLQKVHDFKLDILNLKNSVLAVSVGKRFSDYISAMPAQNHDLLNCWFPEDRLIVRYNDGHRFKDISQGSAGQKAATILSFLLSYGDEPLILDQPEDDLDNGLISSLIVTRLQQNKARRQIIVVTHNPNIVVNGDSEYVIALEDKGQIKPSATGGLQELEVRRQVCEIMEGGEIALAQRYKRMVNIH